MSPPVKAVSFHTFSPPRIMVRVYLEILAFVFIMTRRRRDYREGEWKRNNWLKMTERDNLFTLLYNLLQSIYFHVITYSNIPRLTFVDKAMVLV